MKGIKFLLLGAIFISICLITVSCGTIAKQEPVVTPTPSTQINYTKYSLEFLGTFDSVIQIIGYAKSEQDFKKLTDYAKERMIELNKLYDIYNSYEGLKNVKTINDQAGIAPVAVKKEIIDLISFSKLWYEKTGGEINIALGPVLEIWHDYREKGLEDPETAELPPMTLLKEASRYCDINQVEVDEKNSTVFLTDKHMSLDVGSIAKGYATELVAKELKEKGFDSFVISSGGNVRAVGKPLAGDRTKWAIGIQDPFSEESNELADTVYIESGSVVTSGDYQRYYVVNDKRYHHVIDKDTLMPADNFRSVTIVTEDSGIADFIDTVVFILPFEDGKKLIESLGVDALWIMKDGTMKATENMLKHLKNLGGAVND